MNMIIKRRQLVMATLIIALCAAVFVNWYYTKPKAETTGEVTTSQSIKGTDNKGKNLGDAQYVNSANTSEEYFSAAKLKRNNAHDSAKDTLNNVIKDSKSTPEAIKQASQALADLAKSIKLEADIENLITAKTSGECVVIINDGKAEIIVKKGSLNETTILKITEIVMKQTGFTSEKITIVELNS